VEAGNAWSDNWDADGDEENDGLDGEDKEEDEVESVDHGPASSSVSLRVGGSTLEEVLGAVESSLKGILSIIDVEVLGKFEGVVDVLLELISLSLGIEVFQVLSDLSSGDLGIFK